MKLTKDWVVKFHLPGDALFQYHGTNCRETSREKAMALVQKCLPQAKVYDANEGVICLYGEDWADYDSTLGAESAPLRGWRPCPLR